MPLKLDPREPFAYGKKTFLVSSIARDFVCAECGSKLRHTMQSDYDLFICNDYPEHTGVTVFFYDELEELEEEIQAARKEKILEVAEKHFPEIARALEEKKKEERFLFGNVETEKWL